jgi:hypothetical protein
MRSQNLLRYLKYIWAGKTERKVKDMRAISRSELGYYARAEDTLECEQRRLSTVTTQSPRRTTSAHQAPT